MTGFEAGHVEVVIQENHGLSISAAQARTGTYSLYGNGDRGLTFPWDSAAQEIYGRVGVRASAYPDGDSSFCIHDFLDSAGEKQCGIAVGELGSLEFWRETVNGGTLLAESAPGVFPIDTWVCLEYRIKVDNAAGIGTFRVDGVEVLDFSGDTQDTANANIQHTTGSKNNSWIGRGGIYGLFPEGAGNYTQWTPSAGANYECVDEVPPNDDTDYVADDTVGHKDTYEMEDLVPTDGGITAVQWIARAKLSAAGSGNFQRLLRYSGVDYNGSDLAVDTSYKYFQEIFDQCPDATDWSIAKVNALEAGVEIN